MQTDSRRRTIDNLRATASLLGLLTIGLLLILASLLVDPRHTLLATMLRDIGFVFSPIAAIALLYRQFAEKPHQAELEQRIVDKITSELEQQFQRLANPPERFGCYANRATIDFRSFFGEAEENIDILVTNLQSMQMHLDLLMEKAQHGVEVRILAINPTHDFLRKRFNELSFKKARHFREEMVTALRNAWSLRARIPKPANVEIRVYEHTPTIMLFRRDDDLIISFILRQGRAREHLHLHFGSCERPISTENAACFIEHFEILFRESLEICFDDEDELIVAQADTPDDSEETEQPSPS